MSPHRQTPVLGKVCLDLIDTSKKQSYMAKEATRRTAILDLILTKEGLGDEVEY